MAPGHDSFMHMEIYVYLYGHMICILCHNFWEHDFCLTSNQMIKKVPPRICTSYILPYKQPHSDNDITLVPSCEEWWVVTKKLRAIGTVFLHQSCPQIALPIMNTAFVPPHHMHVVILCFLARCKCCFCMFYLGYVWLLSPIIKHRHQLLIICHWFCTRSKALPDVCQPDHEGIPYSRGAGSAKALVLRTRPSN